MPLYFSLDLSLYYKLYTSMALRFSNNLICIINYASTALRFSNNLICVINCMFLRLYVLVITLFVL